MTSNNELISIREYARRKGCSDTAIHKALKAGKIVKGLVSKGGKKFINPAIADSEWNSNHNPAYDRTTRKGTPVFGEGQAIAEPPTGVPDTGATPRLGNAGQGGEATLANAKRAKAVYDAKIAELTFKEKAGLLVDKQHVYKALFAAGQEVRQALIIIPDRIIDDLLAASSRNAAHQMLTDAIANALDALSDIQNRDITKRE